MASAIGPMRADQLDEVRALFREYRASVDAEICFQTFEHEIAHLPEGYEAILVAADGPSLQGCVAVRRYSNSEAELKRLFVRPKAQGQGLARKLVQTAIEVAHARGYRRILLDTLPSMQAAIALYRALGFVPIERYNNNPAPEALFFAFSLPCTVDHVNERAVD